MNKSTDKQKKARKRNWSLAQTKAMIGMVANISSKTNSTAIQVECKRCINTIETLEKEIRDSDVESWKAL